MAQNFKKNKKDDDDSSSYDGNDADRTDVVGNDESVWGKRDQNHECNKALVGDENFEGPVTNRR
jgi:hypothetical protein